MSEQEVVVLARTFDSDRDELRLIPELLEEVRERCHLDDSQFFNLVVALTEAVNNAIVHGNRHDPALTVRYAVVCREDGVHCIVEDEGEGFDIEAVADPTAPENVHRDGGRGLFLIRSLMRDVRITPMATGTRVEFLCARR